MAICLRLKEVVVFLCILETLKGDSDLLESIQLNAANPPELNDFLQNVMQHKQVFSWIRHAAREADTDALRKIPSRSDVQATTFDKADNFVKRSARYRRPVNDVHPYVFEAENTNNNVRNLRRKRRRQREFARNRRSKGSVSLDLSEESGSSGEVKVAPRSEAGVQSVPGQKYGTKRGIKRTCDEENEQHEHISVKRNNKTKRLEQELVREYDHRNRSCLPPRKADVRREDSASVQGTTNKIPLLPSFPTVKPIKQSQYQSNYVPVHQFYQQPQTYQQIQPLQSVQQIQSLQQLQPLQASVQLQNFQQFKQHADAAQKMMQNNSMNAALGAKKTATLNELKSQDFAKLINYIGTPNKEVVEMSKQDLLRRDNDDVLEHIDRVLKADRGMFRKSPAKRSYKASGKKEMNVDITLNSQPFDLNPTKRTAGKRRKINFTKLKHAKVDDNEYKLTYDTTPSKLFIQPSARSDDEQKQILSHPEVKIMENADDDNDKNLKETLKEYIHRQDEYNSRKQPDENEDEDDSIVDFRVGPGKKNNLEDQTEPTSAAEQRELGRKDGLVTPSMLNDTDSDTLIVIPLKKNVINDNIIAGKNGDYDPTKDGFKVKEAKDIIHVKPPKLNSSDTRGAFSAIEEFENSVHSKDNFRKLKLDLDELTHDDESSLKAKPKVTNYRNNEDYDNMINEKNDKLDPGVQANSGYDDYENFDMKRDLSSVEATNFKSRKLSSVEEGKIRRKREADFDLTEENVGSDKSSLVKRSEDDDPDEEPGNDAKEPTVEEKKVQEPSKQNNLSPKTEEGTMTLHMAPSAEVKRNNTDNDYPPDDENDGLLTGDISNKTLNASRTYISYNYFNITVNMISSTTPSDTSELSTESPPEETQTDDTESLTNQKKEIQQLAQNLLKYTAKTPGLKHFNPLKNYKSYRGEDDDSEKSTIKIQTKDVDDVTNANSNEHTAGYQGDKVNGADFEGSTGPFDMNAVRKILKEVSNKDMLVGDKDVRVREKAVQRSVNEKHDELSDEEIKLNDQIHGVRSAVDNAKHHEMLINKLERLVNSYRSQIQHSTLTEEAKSDTIDKRSDFTSGVHHHSSKKPKQSIPRPDCVSVAPRDEDPIQKHVIKPAHTQYLKPQEVYYEPESMAEDLKEKLLFEKIYNRIVRKRKRIPDPFMYKIIDSVFGNDEEIDENMCPVDLDDENADIEMPIKRTNQKENKETTTPDTGVDLVDISSRQKKKIDDGIETDFRSSREDSIKKQSQEPESKVKWNNVDSFNDVVELPNRIHKRALDGKNLEDFPKNYLSPINEGNTVENRRKRRRLRYLYHPQKKKIRQISYDDYIQTHGIGPNKFISKYASGTVGNFRKGQNSNERKNYKLMHNETNFDSRSTKENNTNRNESSTSSTTTSSTMKSNYKIIEKTCENETLELKANNSKMIECEMQKKEHEDMKKMLNGFLPAKIIEIFYNRLKENTGLFTRFGGSISNSKECASENARNVKLYREEQAKIDIKHAEEMLHEVILMINQIVADQVHRRTCLQLAPNLKIFVIRMTKHLRNLKQDYQVAEGYPLPKIKSRCEDEIPPLPPEEDQGDFLFGAAGEKAPAVKPDSNQEVKLKIKLIEKLLEKYERMSTNCRVQVEPVKNYLLEHLGMLMKLMEKTQQESSTCATTEKNVLPVVNDEELEPPTGNVSISKAMDAKAMCVDSTSSNSTTGDVEDEAPANPSVVSQRQHVMMKKHHEQQVKQQQLQRQLHNQEIIAKQRQLQEQELKEEHQRMQEAHRQMQQQEMQQQQLQQQQQQLQQQRLEQQLDQNQIPQGQLRQLQQPPLQYPDDVLAQPHVRDSQNGQPNQAQSNQTSQNQIPQAQVQVQTAQQVGPNQVASLHGNDTAAVNAIVEAQLDPLHLHYTNPELVTRNLLELGLDGGNTYVPNFDVNRMVQENVVKANIEAHAKGELIPHVQPQPQAPKPVSPPASPKKRDVLSQYDDEDGDEEKEENIRQLSIEDTKATRQAAGAAPQPAQQQPAQQPQQPGQLQQPLPESKGKYANYGKEQFIFQPLLINATVVPDPDIEEREYYSQQRYSDPYLVNKNLVQLGLDGTINSYVMPFTLDSVVQGQIQASTQHTDAKFPVMKPATILQKRGIKEGSSHWNVSDKYKKLLNTYHTLREKRQNEERIGKLYGEKPISAKLGGFKSMNRENHDISSISFEKPIIYSLEG